MGSLKPTSGTVAGLLFAVMILSAGNFVVVASAADAYYEGYLGDVIDLHGVSYSGTQVYLFFTGPGLPENGVILTDTSQRADQGHFTVIDLDNSQQWSIKWDTQRLKTQIDPGTYTVYVSPEPEDKTSLGGSGTYQTLEVYLKDTQTPQGESGPGTYTLNPEKHISSPMPTIVTGSRNLSLSSTPGTTIIIPETTGTIAPKTTPTPGPTSAALSPANAILALIGVIGVVLVRRSRY